MHCSYERSEETGHTGLSWQEGSGNWSTFYTCGEQKSISEHDASSLQTTAGSDPSAELWGSRHWLTEHGVHIQVVSENMDDTVFCLL